MLLNKSFEDGWTTDPITGNQTPSSWTLTWKQSGTAMLSAGAFPGEPNPLDVTLRVPECVHKLSTQLPPNEQLGGANALILDGQATYKVFGVGFSATLTQTLTNPNTRITFSVPVQAHSHGDGSWGACAFRIGIDDNLTQWQTFTAGLNDREWTTVEVSAIVQESCVLRIDMEGRAIAPVDFFIDALSLEIEAGPEPNSVDYTVVVELLPQDATLDEKVYVLQQTHTQRRTILQSADDAARLVAPGLPGSCVSVWAKSRWSGNIAAYLKERGVTTINFFEFCTEIPEPPTSKLGPHIIRATSDIALTYRAPVVKLVGDWGLVDRYGGLVIGRYPIEYATQGDYIAGKSPQQAVDEFMANQVEAITSNPLIQYWEGPNEPVFISAEGLAWYAQFEIERINRLSMMNKKAVIGNFATGTPQLSWWPAFLPAIAHGLANGAILGLHEYSCPWMWWMTGGHQIDPNEDEGDEGWTTLRYRKVYRQFLEPAGLGDIPLVITEAGLDPGVNPRPPGTPAGTWKQLADFWRTNDGRPDTAQYYHEQLKWYEEELKKDEYVIGATIYTWGNHGAPWDAFDVAGTKVAQLLGADWASEVEPDITVLDVRGQLVTNPTSPWHPWKRRALDEITHIFVHHSAGAPDSSLDTVKAIAQYHTSGKNRPGICYTYVIGTDGTIWYVSDIENVVFSQGSIDHPGDENRFGIGVCLLGNFTAGREPTSAQLASLDKLIQQLCVLVNKDLHVWGHKDVIDTQCPGDNWPWKLEWGKHTVPSVPVLVGFNDYPGQTGMAADWLEANGKKGLVVRPIFMGGSGSTLDFSAQKNQRVIVNLRYSWAKDNGGAGTLPLPGTQQWSQFVDAAIYTINNSIGVWGWEIGNEYNNPREFPTTGDLTPQSVAQTYNAIRAGCPSKRLGVGALDPFNARAGDPRNWLTAIYGAITGAEIVFAHGYVRGPDASLVGSQLKFSDDPLRWQYLNYPGCITELLKSLPVIYQKLPIYVTEFNHLWKTVEGDWGWVNDTRATAVIEAAITAAATSGLSGLALYRWAGDEWAVEQNTFVKNAV